MFRKLTIVPAVLTSSFALSSVYFGIGDPDTEPGQLAIRLLAAVFIFASAGLVWAYAFRPALSPKIETWLNLSGWGLIALGGIGGLIATLNGLRSGDFEYYLYLANALFLIQGALQLTASWWKRGAISS